MLNISELANNKELFDGHYALIRPLSVDGATADVWLALDMNTVTADVSVADIVVLDDDKLDQLGLMVAIKIYRPQNALDIEGEQRFRDEYMIVFNCHHTNLIHPTHFSIFRDVPYLVLPYCKLGSSELLIGRLQSSDDIWKYILDVASGLDYLHSLEPPIVHQDIKPANILLDDTKHYAITDFGISAQRGGVHGYYYDDENSGTLAYMAPERFMEGSEPVPQSDIWAFGATLCELLSGHVPFGEEGGKVQLESETSIPTIHGVPADIQRLIHACLDKEPGNRPSAQQLIEAAKAKQYPVKSKRLFFSVALLLLLAIIGFVFFYIAKHDGNQLYTPSVEELYSEALNKMNCNDVDSFKVGLNQMDSLSNINYLPAIYQMALTYGWYSNPVSIRRKQLLGIEMDKEGAPRADHYINKAIGLYNRILEMNDSQYAAINADANFRLAWYYLNHIKDFEKTKSYLYRSREWAIKANDKELMKKIKTGLETFEN